MYMSRPICSLQLSELCFKEFIMYCSSSIKCPGICLAANLPGIYSRQAFIFGCIYILYFARARAPFDPR